MRRRSSSFKSTRRRMTDQMKWAKSRDGATGQRNVGSMRKECATPTPNARCSKSLVFTSDWPSEPRLGRVRLAEPAISIKTVRARKHAGLGNNLRRENSGALHEAPYPLE